MEKIRSGQELCYRNLAQKIILKKAGAIEVVGNDTRPGDSFSYKAKKFKALRENGMNYVQICKELEHEKSI